MYLSQLKGVSQAKSKNNIDSLLEKVGLSEVKNKKVSTYSGGMKQRLGIAQALINNPRLLVLDGPTVGLDPQEHVKFRNLIALLFVSAVTALILDFLFHKKYICDSLGFTRSILFALVISTAIQGGVIGKLLTLFPISNMSADSMLLKLSNSETFFFSNFYLNYSFLLVVMMAAAVFFLVVIVRKQQLQTTL